MPDRERGREFPKAGPVKHKQEVEEETTDPLTVDRASHELQSVEFNCRGPMPDWWGGQGITDGYRNGHVGSVCIALALNICR